MPLNADQKLLWLGISDRQFQEEIWQTKIDQLKELYDFDGIKDKFKNDWSSFSDFAGDVNSENRDDGKGVEGYSNFESKLVHIYDDPADVTSVTQEEKDKAWEEFEDSFLNEYNDYSDFEMEFLSSIAITGNRLSKNGNTMAGIRVHDEPGVTKDGILVPGSTLEIFGNEVHFANTSNARIGGATGGRQSPNITFRNLSVDTLVPLVGESAEVTAEVKNEGNYREIVIVPLLANDEVEDRKSVILQGKEVEEVTFSIQRDGPDIVSVSIGDMDDSTTITWSPRGLVKGF